MARLAFLYRSVFILDTKVIKKDKEVTKNVKFGLKCRKMLLYDKKIGLNGEKMGRKKKEEKKNSRKMKSRLARCF